MRDVGMVNSDHSLTEAGRSEVVNTGAPPAMLDSGNSVARPRNTANGWKARLDMEFEHSARKTVLRRSHTGPLVVQRPFYPEGPVCHAYVLHPPGGIVGGDQLQVTVACGNHACGLVTTPGATKYYGSDGRVATQHQLINLTEGGVLEWMPQETIYFDGCRASQLLQINLAADSVFMGWDISCFGRPAGGHTFETGDVSTRLEINIDGKPRLLERLAIRTARDMSRLTGLRGAVVSGTMVAMAGQRYHKDWLELVRESLPQGNEFSATQLEGLVVVRYLGHRSESARNGFISVWQTLRPLLLQRQAVSPRIWAT